MFYNKAKILILKKADKGNKLVVMDKNDKKQEGQVQIDDRWPFCILLWVMSSYLYLQFKYMIFHVFTCSIFLELCKLTHLAKCVC